MENICIHYQDIQFKLPDKTKTLSWILETIKSKGKECGDINIIFCSDEFLLNINKEYLHHDYYTDIITFDHSDNPDFLESDIYISVDRVKENAIEYDISFIDELHRVMIHGVLHLLGLNDKTKSEKEEMRKIEDHYLALRQF